MRKCVQIPVLIATFFAAVSMVRAEPSGPAFSGGYSLESSTPSKMTVLSATAPNMAGTIRGLGKCADVDHSQTVNGTKIQTWECNGTSAQIFYLTTAGEIRTGFGTCLDVASDGNVREYECNGAPAQRWTFHDTALRSALGKCVDVSSNNWKEGQAAQLYDCNGSDSQRWTYHPQTGAISGRYGLCLDVREDKTSNGTVVQVHSCNGTPAQKWVRDAGGFRTAVASGKCLDIDHSQTNNGTKVQIWDCNGTSAQKFALDGEIHSIDGRCLGISGSKPGNGNQLQVLSCNGAESQRWNFWSSASTPASPPSRQCTGWVTQYGAKGDGVTDDAHALRAALAAGGTVCLPQGVFLVNSYPSDTEDTYVLRFWDDNVILAGEPDGSSVIRVGDGLFGRSDQTNGGRLIYAKDRTGIMLRDLTIDMNGYNNLSQAARANPLTAYAVFLAGGRNVTIDTVSFLDSPGRNVIVAENQGDGLIIRNSVFRNGGTSLTGSSQNDFSAIYSTFTNTVISGCHIFHDKDPFAYSGGIEIHNSYSNVENNLIERSTPAIYVVPPGLPTTPNTTHDVRISGNVVKDSPRGIAFFQIEDLGAAYSDISITDNSFSLRKLSWPVGARQAISGIQYPRPGAGLGNPTTNLTIRDNEFIGMGAKSDSAPSGQFMELSAISGALIEGNRMNGCSGAAISLEGSPHGTRDVSIRGNTISGFGQLNDGVSAVWLDFRDYTGGGQQFTAENITIEGNHVVLEEANPRSCAFYEIWENATATLCAKGADCPSGICSGGKCVVLDPNVTPPIIRNNILSGVSRLTCGPQAGQ